MEINKLTQSTAAGFTSIRKDGDDKNTDKVAGSTGTDSGMAQIEALKKLAENQTKSGIESLEKNLIARFNKITDSNTPVDDACNEWNNYIKDSEEYLKNPESFDRNFDSFLHTGTNEGNVKVVGIQAPWPITGTMDQWYNYIQEKTPDGEVLLTPLGQPVTEGDMFCTHYESGKVWDNNGKPCMTLIGRGKADTRTGSWEVAVYEKGDKGWMQKEDAFNIEACTIGGREVSVYGGTLCINDDLLLDDSQTREIPSFGKDNQIQLLNTKDNSITTFSVDSDGKYS